MLSRNDATAAERSAWTRQIKAWVREQLGVDEELTIMVSELECTEPGCPPRETVIALLRAGGRSEQRKLHVALRDVTQADVQRLLASGGGADDPR